MTERHADTIFFDSFYGIYSVVLRCFSGLIALSKEQIFLQLTYAAN